MQPPKQHSWINLSEIKDQIIKNIGMERSKQYFDYLNRYLSLKLSKAEFDKLCLRTVGKDNIRLHNQLIRLVLKNASRTFRNKKPSNVSYHQNGSVQVVTWVRTGVHNRRRQDRRNALGPNEKTTENGDKDQIDISDRTSLHAPLGVPFCPVSIGGARRALPSANSSKIVGLLHSDGFLETTTLKERMEQITAEQGLQRVSMNCANVLNSGLDAYLKGLIRSSAELNGARPKPEPKRIVTLLDFRVAMELNFKHLGEDWPILLEKICTHTFEE